MRFSLSLSNRRVNASFMLDPYGDICFHFMLHVAVMSIPGPSLCLEAANQYYVHGDMLIDMKVRPMERNGIHLFPTGISISRSNPFPSSIWTLITCHSFSYAQRVPDSCPFQSYVMLPLLGYISRFLSSFLG